MQEEQTDPESCDRMADHGTVAWKWGELSAVGRCAWSVYHTRKAVLWGKAEKASGAPESVCSVSDPVDVGDFCDHRSAPASDLFWQAFPGIWRHRHCSEYWRFPEIYRNLWKAFPGRRTALYSGCF